MRPVIVWVHPEFKKKLKVESAQAQVSMIEFTRKLAQNNPVENNVDGVVKREKRFTFRL